MNILIALVFMIGMWAIPFLIFKVIMFISDKIVGTWEDICDD